MAIPSIFSVIAINRGESLSVFLDGAVLSQLLNRCKARAGIVASDE
jgi:hypothetical protein